MSLAAAPPSPLAICPEPDLPPDLLLPISSSGIMVMYEIISLTRYKENLSYQLNIPNSDTPNMHGNTFYIPVEAKLPDRWPFR